MEYYRELKQQKLFRKDDEGQKLSQDKAEPITFTAKSCHNTTRRHLINMATEVGFVLAKFQF